MNETDQFCTNALSSNKMDFPTFARTRPPDTQISKSVLAVLRHFNWTQISFLHMSGPDTDFGLVAQNIIDQLTNNEDAGINIRQISTWPQQYHHGYTENPFTKIVQQTKDDTRIYVIVGHQYEHIGLLMAMDELRLCDTGQYWVLGVDIEQYDPEDPYKYLHGLLQKKPDKRSFEAFRCYFLVMATAPKNQKDFARKVNHYLELPPFNYPNPLAAIGGAKTIRAEAAYLYDAVHIYARALMQIIENGGDTRDGIEIIEAVKRKHYMSAMGYMVYMDENADAMGNYTIVGFKNNTTNSGLYPIGDFILNEHHTGVPELRLSEEIHWIGDGPPVAEPRCGFQNEKCVNHTTEIASGVTGVIITCVVIISLIAYRNWRYEQELDNLLWKIDFREIQLSGANGAKDDQDDSRKQKNTATAKITRANHPLVRTSQVSLSSNPDADFRYSAIFTPIGLYRGRIVAIKNIRKKSIDLTREMKKELKLMRDIRHDNLNQFIGACTESPDICILSEYCNRGSLRDILENEDVKLDNMFIASLVGDIIRGMIYLHESPLRFHGNLCCSNCLVDSRWVLKLSDFGLHLFKAGQDVETEHVKYDGKHKGLIYRAPELLRAGKFQSVTTNPLFGSQKGDVYSFGLILYEIHTRKGPYGENNMSFDETIYRLINSSQNGEPYRPPLEPLENSFDCVRECLMECWNENPELRPDFKTIRTKLRPLRKGMRPNIFDNMMAMMEKYANNLEQLVDERTDQLQEEKKKTDLLLYEMLPRPVAEQLKRNNKVEAESFDEVSIYFSDIVGFTEMSAQSTPLQVVDFLNDLYTCFDSIIGNYDVYKVETIGDAYMVVSGLPIKNENLHAAEIATMSLHLLRAIDKFRIRHRPEDRLNLRIGIHTGPVCAGVVGLKMPRYCLFGDTVNTASRMESTGLPLKIHCSEATKHLLDELGGYIMEERGYVTMKGKGQQLTYFLIGEDEQTRVKRLLERENRRGSLAPPKDLLVPENLIGPKSSLKTSKTTSIIPRSSSLETPKRLRFASSDTLYLSQHHHNTENSTYCKLSNSRTNSLENNTEGINETHISATTSCPCIEQLVQKTMGLATLQLNLMDNSRIAYNIESNGLKKVKDNGIKRNGKAEMVNPFLEDCAKTPLLVRGCERVKDGDIETIV
ncbi:guanylate cyclase 32E-like [Ctenocephalides felis]|uniref:guanylate cyclase 32E-like n=1 Tax=Ctenocephalides felis TaxID=7515 RepID=UPI000E6E3C04|nr:guanylate cyclase 32E-like [Ctenocephalides felis]